MATFKDLSRISLRTDQVLEVHFDKLPEPPPEMLKLPGVASWFRDLKLMRERDVQAFQRLVVRFQSTPP
jgi:hypothetical protein